jgi:hypothetical protein
MGASDDVPEKARLLREAEEALDDVRLIGDLASRRSSSARSRRSAQTLRAAYAGKVERWLAGSEALERRRARPCAARVAIGRRAFHWEIEFPEVFTRENPGFDAFVGNPPFAGKNTIIAANGANYLPWLLELHEESHGNADLVAHFYRRAFDLLRRREGGVRPDRHQHHRPGRHARTGLRWIRSTAAPSSRPGSASSGRARRPSSCQSCTCTRAAWQGPFDLDGRRWTITAFLFHAGGDEDPARLAANAGKSFQGSIVLGMGFTFDDTDKKGVANAISLMHELIAKDPRNAERIFPYIGGEEVNTARRTRTTATSSTSADVGGGGAAWPDLMAIVEEKVKPSGKLAKSARARRPQTLVAVRARHRRSSSDSRLERVLVIRRHRVAEGRPRYTPPTASKPSRSPRTGNANPAFEPPAASTTSSAPPDGPQQRGPDEDLQPLPRPRRARPDILKLRELHAAMDRAVLDAYGWTDIPPTASSSSTTRSTRTTSRGKPASARSPGATAGPTTLTRRSLERA